jgi:hypothetical protein
MAEGQSGLKSCSARGKKYACFVAVLSNEKLQTSFCNTHYTNDSSILSTGVHGGAAG